MSGCMRLHTFLACSSRARRRPGRAAWGSALSGSVRLAVRARSASSARAAESAMRELWSSPLSMCTPSSGPPSPAPGVSGALEATSADSTRTTELGLPAAGAAGGAVRVLLNMLLMLNIARVVLPARGSVAPFTYVITIACNCQQAFISVAISAATAAVRGNAAAR